MTKTHFDQARDHIGLVHTTADKLADLYEGEGTTAQIADAHQVIGRSLRLAEVHATLAVVQELRDLRHFGAGA